MNYGKTSRDPISLRSLPLRINFPCALTPGHESRRPLLASSSTLHSEGKASFHAEKKSVHKETSLTWSEKSGRSRHTGTLPAIETSSSKDDRGG